jgi:hypothetical protein
MAYQSRNVKDRLAAADRGRVRRPKATTADALTYVQLAGANSATTEVS